MTRLCCSILVRDAQQARADSLRAIEHGADMIELRLDALSSVLEETPEQWYSDAVVLALTRLVDDLSAPVILTCRPAREGGLTDADDDKRITLMAAVAHDVAAHADLEWNALHHAGGWPWAFLKLTGNRPEATKIITSVHDSGGRPANLLSLFADMSQSRADVVKLAWRARTVRDNIEAFELLRDAAKPTIALCMGEAGLASRVLAKKFGAFLSFAALEEGAQAADGQLTLEAMKRLYRWDAIRRSTKVYGVVGASLEHSRSPHVHNAAFEATGFDGVYLPLPVQEGYESFKAFMETFLAFEPLGLAGLSVTLPHKQNALRYVRERGGEVEAMAERIGAANTIRIDHGGEGVRLFAANTDAPALLATLEGAAGGRKTLAGKRIAILGAGGTGRTAVASLAPLGCEITIYNRTLSRAQALAEEFGREGNVRAAPLAEVSRAAADIYLNTTSVGLKGASGTASPERSEEKPWPGRSGVAEDALPALPFSAQTLAFDVIYNPPMTPFLHAAAEAGAKTVGGAEMFLHQASAQFRIWTGLEPPAAQMRRAFEAALGNEG